MKYSELEEKNQRTKLFNNISSYKIDRKEEKAQEILDGKKICRYKNEQ